MRRFRVRRARIVLFVLILLILVGAGLAAINWWRGGRGSDSNFFIRDWLTNPAAHSDWAVTAQTVCTDDAPFIIPTDGFMGLLWADPAGPYNPINRHTGVDIFGAGAAGTIPIYAVYDGYLSRPSDWRSTVIIRHDDPLEPGRTIWTYYTHMASRDGTRSFVAPAFPPGTDEVFVEQGTLLGYQGEYAGAGRPGIAMHLHISIVTSDDDGQYKDERALENTLDPSPYFGVNVNMTNGAMHPVVCAN